MKVTKRQLLPGFYTYGYCFILIAFLLQVSSFPNVYPELYSTMRLLRILGYFCCIVKILFSNSWKKKSILQMVLTFLCVAAATFVTDSEIILTDLLLILASKDIELKKIMGKDSFIRVCFLLPTVIFCILGFVPDITDYRNGILSRHSLGFAHPNRLALHIFMICLYMLYIQYERLKMQHVITICILGVFTLLSTDGRTSCLGILIIFLIALIKWRNNNRKITLLEKNVRFLAPFVFAGSILFSFLAPIFVLTGNLHINPNSTFNSRIIMSAQGLSIYGLKIFGQKIELVAPIMARLSRQTANGIDNMYVYLAVNFGILVFIILLFLFWKGISYSIRIGDKIGAICFLIIIIMGIMENQFLSIESNLFLIYIGQYWMNSRSQLARIREPVGGLYEFSKNKG